MTTLEEYFRANSYLMKVDSHPFSDTYTTTLGIHEALMSAKGWLLEQQARTDIAQPQSMMYRSGWDAAFNFLLEEFKDLFIPSKKSNNKEGKE